jgi:cell division protein ZipA
MDATTLRIILLLLGAIFLAGIYLYETNRRKRDSAQARRRKAKKISKNVERASEETQSEVMETQDIDESFASPEGDETWVNWDEEDTELLEREIQEIGSVEVEDGGPPALKLDRDRESLPKEPKQQDLFGFSAQEESPVDVPVLIIQINLRARSALFTGPAIDKATQETGLVMSELSIYQRLASNGKPQFNMASMVEPGVFPKKDVESFTTPGLTLFTQLPASGDGIAIFSDMLFTAERLAAILDGELQDETHSVLSKQTIEHMRSEIIEHRRKVQLARRKG